MRLTLTVAAALAGERRLRLDKKDWPGWRLACWLTLTRRRMEISIIGKYNHNKHRCYIKQIIKVTYDIVIYIYIYIINNGLYGDWNG